MSIAAGLASAFCISITGETKDELCRLIFYFRRRQHLPFFEKEGKCIKFCVCFLKVHPSTMTVDAGRRLLFLGVILWLGHQDCRALLPPTTDQHVQIGKKNFNFVTLELRITI